MGWSRRCIAVAPNNRHVTKDKDKNVAQNLTNADAALKEFYLPPLRDQLNNENVLDSIVSKNTEDVEGRRAVLSLHVSRNSGVGSRLEGGTLPTAGNQGYVEERVSVKYHYGRIQINGPVIKAMKSDKGSFARAVESEMRRVKDDLGRDYNRQRFGTSNGVIARAGTTNSDTVVVLTSPTNTQLRQLEVGMVIDIGTVASPTTVASDRTITAVDTSAGTITISGAAISTTNSHYIFRAGSGGATGGIGQKELTGLQSIVAASGSLFNVDPSTYPVWASYVDSNSGTNRAPSDTLFEKALDEIQIKSGVNPNVIVTTAGVNRAYANSLKSQKRFTNTVDLKGGHKALEVSTGRNSVGLTWDRDCPANQAFILNTDHLTDYIEADWDFMSEDGAILSRVANTDAYEATIYKYAEQATDRRAAHGLIKDLTEA